MHSDLYPDDLDSVTNNLRDSAKGSNDGYDATFSLTDIAAGSTSFPTSWVPVCPTGS